ncbi:MAG TPA: FAD-dependent oxidoreductase [Solirubrobacter sp.]|nr:FAD-dependent oxidoreductase [Solirubrobacter sp.]
MPETHVIVGGGLAGAKAAEALRNEGFEGRIALFAEEAELPYERPPLSKDYLRGESPREQARVHPEQFYADNDIELRTGTRVTAIDTATTAVVLADGERIRYDRLLLATGARPRRLNVTGAELDGLLTLRELNDADTLRARLSASPRLVVVGAGWIGAEVAASARQLGCDVTVVEVAEVPLQHVLGREIGGLYAEIHRDHGVRLLTGVSVHGFAGAGRVERVELADGRAIDCDLVVAGVGVSPRVELAEAGGLAVENGILVDAQLQTSVPGIFAAGDVANVAHPFYGHRLRVEHWANALHQPEVAAPAMLGKPAVWDRLPYFFSDQYDVGMEYAGLASGDDEVLIRGDRDRRELIAFWLRDERVVAGMNVNVWDVTDDIQALIRAGRPVDRARLADPEVPLLDAQKSAAAAR